MSADSGRSVPVEGLLLLWRLKFVVATLAAAWIGLVLAHAAFDLSFWTVFPAVSVAETLVPFLALRRLLGAAASFARTLWRFLGFMFFDAVLCLVAVIPFALAFAISGSHDPIALTETAMISTGLAIAYYAVVAIGGMRLPAVVAGEFADMSQIWLHGGWEKRRVAVALICFCAPPCVALEILAEKSDMGTRPASPPRFSFPDTGLIVLILMAHQWVGACFAVVLARAWRRSKARAAPAGEPDAAAMP